MTAKLELDGAEIDLSQHFDCEQSIVVRVSACEVKVVRIVHRSKYKGPGQPPEKWDEETLLLDISGEGIEITEELT